MIVMRNSGGRHRRVRPRDLLAAAQRTTKDNREPLRAAFMRATVYVERSQYSTGLRLHNRPDGTFWVHAYSLRNRVPGIEHTDLDVTEMTGAHLLSQLPTGVGVFLDVGGGTPIDVVPADPRDRGLDIERGRADQ